MSVEIPEGVDYDVHRVAYAYKISPAEVLECWCIDAVIEAHDFLDMQEELDAKRSDALNKAMNPPAPG